MRKHRMWMLVSLVAVLALVMAACQAGGEEEVKYDDNASIVVWIDAARKPAADKYLETHPDRAKQVTIEIVDRAEFSAKVLLFNNAGKGWPDVVFAEPSIIMYNADEAHDYPMDLTPWVDKEIIDKFVPGALDPCKSYDGKLLCLRNDIAPNVLWYNKPLMEEFGYALPTTWQEYQDLSDKVAADHPGYLMGSAGAEPRVFFWSSGCPVAQPISETKVVINAMDEKCTRVTKMVDHMLQNGTMSRYDFFDPKFIEEANNNKILMLPGANWMGDFVFGGTADSTYYKTAEHQLAAVQMPIWGPGDDYTSAWGGSSWAVSRHTINPKLAVEVAVYMTTDIEVGKLVGTMPGYGPAADAWKAGMDSNPLYDSNPYDVMVEASAKVNPNFTDTVRYDVISGFKPFLSAIEQGTSTTDSLPEVEKMLKDLAAKEGYTEIVQKP